MKIVTWNVNGLRALLRKQALGPVLELDADVVCLQEIKAKQEQLPEAQREFPGYRAIWNPADRPGYSGVATLSREGPLGVELGMGTPRFDVEGRLIRTRHPGFMLYNVYFPSGRRGQERVDYKLAFYAQLLEACEALRASGEGLILTGDFNTAHRPIDLRNPRQNEATSGFLPEEREWVQRFLDRGFVDVYRELYPERAQYTWWTYRFNARARGIGWRLDYFLISSDLAPCVQDVIIHDQIEGSDHCPVELRLNRC